jgi:hypothetical protein
VERAHAAEVELVVGRLETQRHVDVTQVGVLVEDGAELVFGDGALVARVEHEGEVAADRVAHRLGEDDHHREPALHVARAGAVEPRALDAGRAVLGAHRVEVADEGDVGALLPRAHHRDDDRVAVAAHRGGERPAAQPVGDGGADRLLLADGRLHLAEPEQGLVERDRERRAERLRRLHLHTLTP